jgi:hypothetical protein
MKWWAATESAIPCSAIKCRIDRRFANVEGRFLQRRKEIEPNDYCRVSFTENSPLRMRAPRLSA